MIMHGPVRQPQSEQVETGRNHRKMEKRWRGNVHGVLRRPEAPHRPARIFRRRRRRTSLPTLHRPPSITMQLSPHRKLANPNNHHKKQQRLPPPRYISTATSSSSSRVLSKKLGFFFSRPDQFGDLTGKRGGAVVG